MELTPEQYSGIADKVGVEATAKINAICDAATIKMQATIEAAKAGTLTTTQLDATKSELETSIASVKSIAVSQGVSINEILARLDNPTGNGKTIRQQFAEDRTELIDVYKSKNRSKEYLVNTDGKGNWSMVPFDTVKAAGPHATADNVTTNGNTASVSQNFSASTLLRMAGDSPIMSGYRNTPWIFDLANTVTVGFDQRFFTWFDENVKQGASALVLEGGTKPAVQYSYTLQNSSYLKEAQLVSFTDEFDLDFARLEADIISKSRIDLINRINAAILPRMFAAATAYNQGASYAPDGDKITNPNDWDVIAALAAQAENATYSTQANTAVVSTNKKYRMNTLKDAEERWLNIPPILQNLALVSNPDFTTANVMVGDLKQYNIALRGGIIVKVGYNGTDFAENKFSIVMEQFYYDYISAMRKPAIVKGPTFEAVKAVLAA